MNQVPWIPVSARRARSRSAPTRPNSPREMFPGERERIEPIQTEIASKSNVRHTESDGSLPGEVVEAMRLSPVEYRKPPDSTSLLGPRGLLSCRRAAGWLPTD